MHVVVHQHVRMQSDIGDGQRLAQQFQIVDAVNVVQEKRHGVPIKVGSIRHLIRLKQVAGRPQDMLDIDALRMVAAETGQEIR